MITQEGLKELLDYNEESGVFLWKASSNGRVKVGDRAGSVTNRGYSRISIGGKRYLSHHLAFLFVHGFIPKEIDHIDGNRSNNAIANLREVTRSENCKNMKRSSRNKSGVTGVSFNKKLSKWRADICVNGKAIYLGAFEEFLKAKEARLQAEIKYGFHENHGRYHE
jgi:hypothetical protein